MKKRRVRSEATSPSARPFPIVAVGASAGGLEAFTQLLHELPADTGMAFVLIQHLDPKHASLLSEALARATRMPVRQAEDGQRLEPNHVYVIPPNADIGVLHGRLTLLPRDDAAHRPHLPIDFFCRALAAERGGHAIGVILSGTASDGTEGLKAIKAGNGITFAQDPKSAKFGGMPHSAIEAGVVDYALRIPELAAELARLSRHPYVAARETAPRKSDQSTLRKIFVIVRNAVGVDFSEYKLTTVQRRLARRMALRRVEDLQRYLTILQKEPAEISALYEDVLIHVTSFFGDPEVFERLSANALPEIMKKKPDGGALRAWVAGCSMGEEVYSLAIVLLEFLGNQHGHPIQIFGSDVSEKAIERSRAGVYPESAMNGVSDERRRRYFSKVENGYRINKAVRDLCVFVRHDLARDPPFSRLDLVSCRNVLIYFDQALQKRVVPTIHYALNQPGFLILGRTENISGFSQLFSPVDKSNKIFERTSLRSTLQFAPRSEVHPAVVNRAGVAFQGQPRRAVDIGKHLDRVLMSRFSPPSVLINEKMEILHYRGETGTFLQPAPGEPQNNLLKMARGGLLSELRSTIAKAKKAMAPARTEGIAVEQNGVRTLCDIEVVPFTGAPETNEHLFLVLFEEAGKARRAKAARGGATRPMRAIDKSPDAQKLRHELAATKEYLQSLIDDHGRTNEELNAANEELVSGNEELQSMNEELETAKEELQSTNEELLTVNEELHSRNQEVNVINSDLVNLLGTVDVPILILDIERRIRRFTPKARSILNVLPSDVGRPLDDIKLNIEVPDLAQQISDVIETNTLRESEVQDRKGRWYRMQIRPYKTIDNKIDGATLSLVDIDSLKHHVEEVEAANAEAERANRIKDQFLATLSHELRTPLSTMLMQAQMLRSTEEPKAKRAAEAIERATKMQVQLIDDLLDVSRIVAGKLRMDLEAVDLTMVVRAAAESVSAPVEKKGIILKLLLDESIGKVSGDASRLQQVVANLLTNAVKFTPAGGQVTLVLEAEDGSAHLTVSDSGMGIDPSFLPHVFNRFSQEDGSNTRTYGGLGLGLAIVRHLVEAHGGSVTAQSQGAGKGATFSVTLPLMAGYLDSSDDDLQDVAREHSLDGGSKLAATRRAAESLPLKGLRALVVDDDQGTREVLSEMLGRAGAEVAVAQSANDAMPLFDAFHPEVLLSDIAMPGEDGYAFIRRVRARGPAQGGNIPALALTALAGEEDHARALSAGFQMHVAKPVDVARLLHAVVELWHLADQSLVGARVSGSTLSS